MNIQETIKRILREELEVNLTLRSKQKITHEYQKNVKISDILPFNTDGQNIEDAIVNVKDGLKSHSQYPPLLLKRGDKYKILDGFHRIAQKILDGKKYVISNVIIKEEFLNESDPKTGIGKKPKGSDRRLYTDENPSDTVSVKFKTKEDIVDTLNKESFKSKSHARQSQIINLIHQRLRAAYQNASDPETKKRLKRGLDYIENEKEKSKKKTVELQKGEMKEGELTEKCWAGYTQKGMKTMFGKRYPNCVKKTK